jgi:hypothetical protein
MAPISGISPRFTMLSAMSYIKQLANSQTLLSK